MDEQSTQETGKIRAILSGKHGRAAARGSKKLFWVWIAYQAVKGTLTTSLIWIPLIYAWMHHR